MTEPKIIVGVIGVEGSEPRRVTAAGAMLASAREAAGLSVDAVAQQLKLAPRQVKALEEGDYDRLPGRTFVRGFVKSYARLVRLDPERVLAALPAGAAGALEAPQLQQTAPTIGELPTSDHSKPTWTRWAIPITLAAIVAAAATYEWLRPAGDGRAAVDKEPAANVARPAEAPAVPAKAGTSLPNPLAVAPAPEQSAAPPPSLATPPSSFSAAPPAPVPVPAPLPASSPTLPPTSGAIQPLMLSFRDYSWTEVRDRDGRVLVSGMNPGGTERVLSGNPPLDLVIGNAVDVSVTFRGTPVDLAPHTRQNVARLSLP